MAHNRKRQFQPSSNQPSIKSFFTRIDPANPTADFDPYDRKHVPAFAPPLPDPVQSQLMNMGMRIRKSVPEGYKTHKTLPAMAPPSSLPALKRTLSHTGGPPTSSAPALYSKPSELTPMCGLHKIGGYSSQPTTSSISSMPSLTYSQSTLSTVSSTPTTPNNTLKRSYDDEIEDQLDAIFSDDQADKDAEDVRLTPSKTKYPFSHSSMPELNRKVGFVRPGSRPKARMRAKMSPEKMAALAAADKDFDDADVNFLQPMDCED